MFDLCNSDTLEGYLTCLQAKVSVNSFLVLSWLKGTGTVKANLSQFCGCKGIVKKKSFKSMMINFQTLQIMLEWEVPVEVELSY